MVWQDLVLAGGGFVLTVGLVPMLRSAERPPLRTSVTLLVVLSSYVVTLASLALWIAATGTALQAALWGVLAAQRWQSTRRRTASDALMTVAAAADPVPPEVEQGSAAITGERNARS